MRVRARRSENGDANIWIRESQHARHRNRPRVFATQDWPLAAGRTFLDGEIRGGKAACIIGTTVHDKLFSKGDALGLSMRVGKVSCEVVGILDVKGQSSGGSDQDDVVLVPLRVFSGGSPAIATYRVFQFPQRKELRHRKSRRISSASFESGAIFRLERMTISRSATWRKLRQLRPGTTTVLTGLLGAVAGVSLLVGGIEIMNIMLVSVTERTREIGICLAIGALEGQVLLQFLVEAVVLSLFGGIIGILLGLSLALVGTRSLEIPFAFDPIIVIVAFAFSAIVGVIFGYFPARRAARLDPIEALRRE